MSVGTALKGLRERHNFTQSEIAEKFYVDQTLISKIEKGERKATPDFIAKSIDYYDDAQYGLELAHELIKSYVTPLLNKNQGVEWHRMALEETFKAEGMEAIEHFNNVSLAKNPDYVTTEELIEIKKGVKEVLDAIMSMVSFLVILEQTYPKISIKKCMREHIPHWKSKGWI